MLAIKDRNDIDIEQVLRNIGYRSSRKLPARMVTLISDYVEHAGYLVDSSYSYVIKDIEQVHGSYAMIEGSIAFKSEVIAGLLENCNKVAVFLTTIGGYLEEMVNQLAEDKFVLQAAVLDAIGSGAVEKLANTVQKMVGDEASTEGLYMSQRFSPGYCDWNVEQQRMVFQAMDGDSVGIKLTEECLMLPRKSVSGIIGIGPSEVAEYNPCRTCNKRDCAGRRKHSK
jgi:hypothetical protein